MPDYMFLLESRLSPEQRAVVLRVQELARIQEANVYLAGGAVRDLISGMPIRDLDFVVEGNPSRMWRELEKGGARIVEEDERLRHAEIVFSGDADGSVGSARDDLYDRPGARPEIRWSTIMEDLRRRDFSINAIAISLNPASRGLLLDPTNGLADLERREVRALSIHAFTNQPIRLLRILRYCARMGFKMEARTEEWFELAMHRRLQESLDPESVGRELRQLGREDNPAVILKAWEAHGLLGVIHPDLERRRPDYDALAHLARVRASMMTAGVRPRLFAPVTHYVLRRLGSRKLSGTLHRTAFRRTEIDAVAQLTSEAQNALKVLKSRKTRTPRDAYDFLAKTRLDLLAFLQTEYPNPKVLAKIRNYFQRWRPLRASLPVAELDALGVARGPKFDRILEDLFSWQLRGKGRMPPARTKLLRKLAGIKEEPKKKRKEGKHKARMPAAGRMAAQAEAPSAARGRPEAAPTVASRPTPAEMLKAARSQKAGEGEKPASRFRNRVRGKRARRGRH